MKNFLFTLAFLVICSCTNVAEKPIDSTQGRLSETEFTLSDGKWVAVKKISYSYTDFGKVEHQLITVLQDYSIWQNNSQSYFHYNEDQNLSFVERNVWREDTWQKLIGSSYIYEGGFISIRTDSTFLPSGKINITGHSYFYNEQNMVTEELGSRINGAESIIVSRLLYIYNDKNLITEKNWQKYENGDWINLRRMVFTYDEGLNHTVTLRQNWEANEWQNSVRYLLTVNEDSKRTDAVWQRYLENSWQDFRKVIYEY